MAARHVPATSLFCKAMTPLRAFVLGGVTVGVLDLTDACVYWYLQAGSPPVRIFQSIAAGLLGRESFQGGLATAALGVGLHFSIAFSIAGTYALASRRLPVLTDRWVLCGIAYGVAAYLFMSQVVLPLSAAGPSKWNLPWVIDSVLIHAFGVGLPSAFFARLGAAARARRAVRDEVSFAGSASETSAG